MKNGAYWKKRFKQIEESQHQQGLQCYADIEEQYLVAQRQMEAKINAWYQRFANNNAISLVEARRLLNSSELDELKWDVEQYIRYGKENAINGQWMKELENASAKVHINRLEALKLQMQQSLEVMFGNQLDSVDSTIRDVYQFGFLHTAYEIQKGIGTGWSFASPNDRLIDTVIHKPWAADGQTFSDRIWTNKQKLVNELNTTMVQNIITGADPQKTIDALARKMNVSKQNAGRLVMTEQAAFSNAAQKDCFAELGVEQFEILETLDSFTCSLCGSMDGQHFPMSQYEIGVTAPPFHPNCRGCTCPYFEDDFGVPGERAARGEDGKTYYVPGNMTYEEWKFSFADGNNAAKDRLGIITNNNKRNPNYYDFKGKNVDTVESEICKFDHEVGVIFDNGKAVNCQLGNEDTIEFTKYQLKMMKGKDVTHNHPLSTPPSPEDLYLLVNYKVKSFRTCGENGTYVLEYNEQVEKLPDFKTFSDTYDEIIYELQDKYYDEVKHGMKQEDAIILLGEAAWERLYELYNVKPRFERR